MVVVVSGANGGIGRAISAALLDRKVGVVACYRNMTSDFSEWIKYAQDSYGTLINVERLDLSSNESAKTDAKRIIENYEVQGLVNNAALAAGSLFMMTPEKKLKEVFEVNFFSTIQVSQVIAKSMIKNSKGRIVNVSSISGHFSSRGFLSYGASKAALDYATKIMAEELAMYGITVNSVAPGLTETPMLDEMEEVAKEWFRQLSFSKKFSRPDELANLVTYLLLDSPSQLTGQVISLDGGMP